MSVPVLLGISGSIAAYKSPDLIRLLVKAGFCVTPILSVNASKFVSPLSLSVVSQTETLMQDHFYSWQMPHLKVLKNAKAFVIAPASASMIAKLNAGMSDDLLSATWLSFHGPKLIVPAMHEEMWESSLAQVDHLKRQGVQVMSPVYGDLASGDRGQGRFPDLSLIALRIQLLRHTPLSFAGQEIVVTLGGTSEPLDKVRVLTNRSTGKMGSYLAWLAHFYGAKVTVITTCPVLDPGFHRVIQVETAEELYTQVMSVFPTADVLIMAAAVSDFTCEKSESKLSRNQGFQLQLTPTQDILKAVSVSKKPHQKVVGFCLEDDNLMTVAEEKFKNKKVDVMVANHSQNIGSEVRTVCILHQNNAQWLENLPIHDVAYHILKKI